MKNSKFTVLSIVLLLLITGCGNPPPSTTPTPGSAGTTAQAGDVIQNAEAPVQMGGTLQGTPLVLNRVVSTVYIDPLFTGGNLVLPPDNAYVQGITTDGTSIFMTNGLNHTIQKMVIKTGVMTTLAGTAWVRGTTDSDDGMGRTARFSDPRGITTDGNHLYVVDSGNFTIRKIAIDTGLVTTLAGNAGSSSVTDGTGKAARFGNPEGITTDGRYLFVTDAGSTHTENTIRMVEIATGKVTTLAIVAMPLREGVAFRGRVNLLGGITSDGTSLFICDTFNGTIRKVVIATGVETTIAGTYGVSGYSDGIGSDAMFIDPVDITTDGANLYVADYGNRIIRKIAIATGMVTTLAGTVVTSGSTDGIGPAAAFNNPKGITSDGSSLFVTEYKNSIRKIK